MPHDARRDGHGGARHADVGTPHPTMRKYLTDDPFCRIDSRGKANRLSLRDHRRIDADDPPPRIDQRAAGIAGIERSIGLNDIVHEPAGFARKVRPSADTTPVVTRLRIAERIADGNGNLTHFQTGGIAEFRVGQRAGDADAQHRQIRIRIVAHEVGMEPRIVIQTHGDLIRPVHDMTVGEQIAIRREEKTRPAGLLPRAGRVPPARTGPATSMKVTAGATRSSAPITAPE